MWRAGCVVVVAATLLAPAAPSVAVAAPAVDPTGRAGFIVALAQIPRSVEVLAASRVVVRDARAQRDLAVSVAAGVQSSFDAATDTLHEQTLVRTRAELAAAGAQESLDAVARQMYSSGGSAPSLVDVMLTADSEYGLMRSLVTRHYLASAAGEQVTADIWVQDAATAAEESATQAEYQWGLAADNWRSAATGVASATKNFAAAQVGVVTARKAYRKLMKATEVDHSADYGHIKKCGDWLVRLLSKTGFTGENLREAWAIAMRESGGREDAVSSSNDLGIFQINTATWQDQPWFDREALLTREFNAKIGYLLSQGGTSWYSWGLDGHGRPDAGAYVKSGWTEERIVAKIIDPYVLWYARYPCRPAYETNDWAALPIDIVEASKPRYEDNASQALAAGGGQLPSQGPSSGPDPLASVPTEPVPPVPGESMTPAPASVPPGLTTPEPTASETTASDPPTPASSATPTPQPSGP